MKLSMPFFKNIILAFAIFSSVNSLAAKCCGKIDVGPAFLHIDVLESGKTVKRMDIGGVRADGAFRLDCGLCFKPTITYGTGHGDIFTGGGGIGFCIPFCDNKLVFTPAAGCTYTNLKTHVNLHFPGGTHLKERFRSVSPYIGLEATYTFCESWRVGGYVQYAWSHTHTTVSHIFSDKSWAKGFNYAASIEKDLNQSWSVNAAFGYNSSMSREKHGIRGYGTKIGLAYWF